MSEREEKHFVQIKCFFLLACAFTKEKQNSDKHFFFLISTYTHIHDRFYEQSPVDHRNRTHIENEVISCVYAKTKQSDEKNINADECRSIVRNSMNQVDMIAAAAVVAVDETEDRELEVSAYQQVIHVGEYFDYLNFHRNHSDNLDTDHNH